MLDEIADPDAVEPEAPPLPPEQFVAMVTQSQNLAVELTEAKLTEIAQQVLEDYRLDKDSMSDWLERMKRGLDLAKLIKVEKTYPFKNPSNVKYPLVASAAMQFNARAYPAIVPADQVVRAATFGKDPQGKKAARGERVSGHMSWQLQSEIAEWEEDTDKLLLQLPIVGTMVRKWWYDPVRERPRCRLLEPGKFIVNDKVRNLSDAPRCSEELPLYPAEIKTRMTSGQFVEFEYDRPTDDKQAVQEFVEQHCLIDLDDDGYFEPYIVTVHVDKETVVRIVADFDPENVQYTRETQNVLAQGVDPYTGMMVEFTQPQEVVTGIAAIDRGSYFEAFKFVPGIDGGFWGTGLGLLLGDISDTINTIINLMIDAGHMASLGGGFIGSEFRIKGGSQRFAPGEWKTPAAQGADIKSGIVPLTFPGPDATLFQMLGLLIDAGREISSTKDIMTGDNGGKVQTATTTLALIEQGMMVFSAAYKRIFRSLKAEYKMLAKINAGTVTPEAYNRFHDEVDQQGQPVMYDPAKEYDLSDMDIVPVADPRSVTKMQQMAKAELISNLAERGLVPPQAAAKRVLEAAEIGDIEELAPPPDPMQEQLQQFAMQMQVEGAQTALALQRVEVDLKLAQIDKLRSETVENMADAKATEANIRLDGMKLLLEGRRDAIDHTIKTGEQTLKAGLGRLEIQSRDRDSQRRAAVGAEKARAGLRGGVSGG